MKVVSSANINQTIQQQFKEKYPDIQFVFCENMKKAESEVEEADILITFGNDLSEGHVQLAKQLKWVHLLAVGFENLPIKVIKERDILVTNSHSIHAIPMSEYTISMLLNVMRNEKLLLKNEREKIWGQWIKIEEITGKTIAILGTGSIGQEIARVAKAFRMTTLGYNRSGNSVTEFDEIFTYNRLPEMLLKADFVVSVLPATNKTKNFIDKSLFKAMKSEAVFMNIGRGSTVCEEDLINALNEGEISHAILDVFQIEPLRREHPFWEMDNVTVTPHLSSLSTNYQKRAFEIFEKNLIQFLSGTGTYMNKVNMERGY